MAAWKIQRQILSLLATKKPQTYISKGLPTSFVSPARLSFRTDKVCSRRCFQTVPEITKQAVEWGKVIKTLIQMLILILLLQLSLISRKRPHTSTLCNLI